MKKRAFVFLLCIIICVSMVGCGGTKRESAETVTENALKAFQTVDAEGMATYWGSDVTESGDEVQSSDMMKAVLANLTYSIISSQEDEASGVATVTVELTNTDVRPVMGLWLQEMLSTAFQYAFLPEDQQLGDEEMEQLAYESFIRLLDEGKDTTVTNTVEVKLKLVEDKWVLEEPTEELIDAILGGMYSALNELDDAFN
ncbi:MAG: hypothetical protein HFF09_07285 [Oscillospiraceae bacterium]|nr:hypothetical protein [Oscillospiraceae bacterium]